MTPRKTKCWFHERGEGSYSLGFFTKNEKKIIKNLFFFEFSIFLSFTITHHCSLTQLFLLTLFLFVWNNIKVTMAAFCISITSIIFFFSKKKKVNFLKNQQPFWASSTTVNCSTRLQIMSKCRGKSISKITCKTTFHFSFFVAPFLSWEKMLEK